MNQINPVWKQISSISNNTSDIVEQNIDETNSKVENIRKTNYTNVFWGEAYKKHWDNLISWKFLESDLEMIWTLERCFWEKHVKNLDLSSELAYKLFNVFDFKELFPLINTIAKKLWIFNNYHHDNDINLLNKPLFLSLLNWSTHVSEKYELYRLIKDLLEIDWFDTTWIIDIDLTPYIENRSQKFLIDFIEYFNISEIKFLSNKDVIKTITKNDFYSKNDLKEIEGIFWKKITKKEILNWNLNILLKLFLDCSENTKKTVKFLLNYFNITQKDLKNKQIANNVKNLIDFVGLNSIFVLGKVKEKLKDSFTYFEELMWFPIIFEDFQNEKYSILISEICKEYLQNKQEKLDEEEKQHVNFFTKFHDISWFHDFTW